jgi:LPS-assembly protein
MLFSQRPVGNVLLALLSIGTLAAQVYRPGGSTGSLRQHQEPAAPAPARSTAIPHPDPPAPHDVRVSAAVQESEGKLYKLRGHAIIETLELYLSADEIDYQEDTGDAEARGNVHFIHYAGGEDIHCDKVEYNVSEETGKFYNIRGTAPAKIEARPGVLTTSNPFYFQGRWAERIGERYVLHRGFVTNCRLPRPWWTLHGPTFDIIPGNRAIARHSTFRLRGIPLFYTPFFYKSLEKLPRRSGFLTPNIGNSSRRGKMVGIGYYWAINRSLDATYRGQYLTERGFAHHVDFRGKPIAGTDFNFILYGVNDRGLLKDDGTREKQGGYLLSFEGKSQLPGGFEAMANINYLSSYLFRQSFTESFYEAIQSEVHSTGIVTRHWSSFGLNFIGQRDEVFLSTTPGDQITIRKLPEVQFLSRERQVNDRVLPIWVSLWSTAGLEYRTQPSFTTRQFVQRLDFQPRITTALRWKYFTLLPSFSLRETYYGSSVSDGKISGDNYTRSAREFNIDLSLPAFERVFNSPKAFGKKLKHVIEPRASFRYVTGIGSDFSKMIRFDETELMSDTTEAEIGIINRIYAKRADGNVDEVFSWQLFQRRYFDPTFGGAIVEGTRNVLLSSVELTPFAFLDRPRNYSPISSTVRVSPRGGYAVEWRADYDPLRHAFTNSNISGDAHFSNYTVSVGHSQVRCILLEVPGVPSTACEDASSQRLSPVANQFNGLLGFGRDNRRGWSAAFSAAYDYREGVLRYSATQIAYNSDCCGISVQYRRFSFGTRNENQFRIAFAVSNIGSFGTLKKQERIF